MSLELTETKQNVEESLEALSRVPTPPLDEQTEQEVHKMEVQEVVRTLEDTLSQKQWPRAVQLLRSARSRETEAASGTALTYFPTLVGNTVEEWSSLAVERRMTWTVCSTSMPDTSQSGRKVP